MTSLFNGQAAPEWAATRGLQYGDGVFRTMLIWDGAVVNQDAQLATLMRDASALQLDPPDSGVLRAEAHALAATAAQGVLKILLSRRDPGRGYASTSRTVDRLLRVAPLTPHPASNWDAGIQVHWSSVLLGIQPRLAGIKHLNRLEQVLASRDWTPDQGEALMCDAEGRVIGGTRSNLFCVIDDILVTPDLSRSGVAGMMRGQLMALAHACGVPCEIGLVAPDELRHAQECFMSNSLIGIWPVRAIGSLQLPAPGPVTRRLRAALRHPWNGVGSGA